MVLTMTEQKKASRPASEYEQLEYERCEVCGQPIARGVMPTGPYDPVFIQCHNKRNGVKCGHRNRFPRR